MIYTQAVPGSHASFPLTAPALQSASLKPDFRYFEISLARQLSDLLKPPKPTFSPSELAAIGLIGQIDLFLVQQYLLRSPNAFSSLDQFLLQELGDASANSVLSKIIDSFPTSLTFNNPAQKKSYQFTPPAKNDARHAYYYSLILILVADQNPAIKSRDGIFTDHNLHSSPYFDQLVSALQTFFSGKTEMGPGGMSLVEMLLEPGRKFPDSIYDQLSYISNHWANYLDQNLLRSLIIGLDQLKEEAVREPAGKIVQNPLGNISLEGGLENDPINFSPDRDWMPNVILQAKNIYVWLDQLSREYQRTISRLDQVPEEEFALLSQRGINTLWLIGIWERSPASQRIKQLCGNPEAASSAYSLYDYSISLSLGGEAAYQHLSSIASKHRIRLAADMVPNHMGIDSRWIYEHPEYFLSLDYPPFPSYSFNGPDLSSKPDQSIFLEDHYYDQTDAAVVFKHQDNNSGKTRYIYHGNDGTSMPWNDTAQLDYLNPEVREAIIQTILEVARKFPVIRFDAAMTLSKKHYQRLWFPLPGSGGAIPTRSSFSLSKKAFDSHMPVEFWRELVDRVAAEVPDTLLLAEAFWMMEGYFVRTLGMHRVYNSAFMHMLKDEDNDKYRQLIIDTLEFDPQIMKRYVNFMNNPDEETALSQFGSGGKYFGTCLVMSTLPGLPMFGHGQIEGLAEKYGMEYLKAYYDESPDPDFIARHDREIFPLLHKRYLFSGVDHFALFDLTRQDGSVDDDVFAYSNCAGSENALIVFHNKWGDTRGRICSSTPINGNTTTLSSALGLSVDENDFVTFYDQISGLEYIRNLNDFDRNGFYLELGAYDYRAFLNFKAVRDTDGNLAGVERILNGKGTLSLSKLSLEIKYSPLTNPITQIVSKSDQLKNKENRKKNSLSDLDPLSQEMISGAVNTFWETLLSLFPDLITDTFPGKKNIQERLLAVIMLVSNPEVSSIAPGAHILLPWSFLADLPGLIQKDNLQTILDLTSASISELELVNISDHDWYARELTLAVTLSTLLVDTPLDPARLAKFWLDNPHNRHYINLHEHDGKEWFHKESMESLLKLTLTLILINQYLNKSASLKNLVPEDTKLAAFYTNALKAMEESEYQADEFSALISRLDLMKKN